MNKLRGVQRFPAIKLPIILLRANNFQFLQRMLGSIKKSYNLINKDNTESGPVGSGGDILFYYYKYHCKYRKVSLYNFLRRCKLLEKSESYEIVRVAPLLICL